MRLLNAKTKEITKFLDDELPEYAILSHTWDRDEVTLQDMKNLYSDGYPTYGNPDSVHDVQSLKKIKGCCEESLKHGLDWVWIDTCCIDRTDSVELSEAINSMFRWYREAAACYVYLADVPDDNNTDTSFDSPFCNSRWFTRGWTLQELLAPKHAYFYSSCWSLLGERRQLSTSLHRATGISVQVLERGDFRYTSVAQRMSWASKRTTSRKEDIAYCLLGIFDVNMPLLYGEGERKAFFRLQEEIVKTSRDDSLFAWGVTLDGLQQLDEVGLLAQSPRDFASCSNVVRCQSLLSHQDNDFEFMKGCVKMKIPISKVIEFGFPKVAVLNCRLAFETNNFLGIPLLPSSVVNSSTLWEEDGVSMERPRALAMVSYSGTHINRRKKTTIFVGSGTDTTYGAGSQVGLITYEASLVPAEFRLHMQENKIIIPPPSGIFRWRVSVLYSDPAFRITTGHRDRSCPGMEVGIESFERLTTPSTFLLYEADGVDGDCSMRFLLRLTVKPARRLIKFLKYGVNGAYLECAVSYIPEDRVPLHYRPEDLLDRHWRPVVQMNDTTITAYILPERDSQKVHIYCTPTSTDLRSEVVDFLKYDIHAAKKSSGLGGAILNILGLVLLCLSFAFQRLDLLHDLTGSISSAMGSALLASALFWQFICGHHFFTTILVFIVVNFMLIIFLGLAHI